MSPDSGQTYILIFNEALWMGGTMDHTLVNPNQLCSFGMIVQDNPFSPSPLHITTEGCDFTLPLGTRGTTIFADTRSPTPQELKECLHIELSSSHPWNPQTIQFPQAVRSVQEEVEEMRHVAQVNAAAIGNNRPTDDDRPALFDLDRLTRRLISSIQVADVPQARTFESKERHTSVTPEDLSERWHIGIGQARETLKRTTHKLVRSAVMPLSRRYKADRMFHKRQLQGTWATDTMDGRVVSLDGNQYGQVFANTGYFATIYPMD